MAGHTEANVTSMTGIVDGRMKAEACSAQSGQVVNINECGRQKTQTSFCRHAGRFLHAQFFGGAFDKRFQTDSKTLPFIIGK